MSMTSKERMMRALHREKPDRLPVTIHQWQQYHLDTYMGGMDALDAFKTCGLDAVDPVFRGDGPVLDSRRGEVRRRSRPSGAEQMVVVDDDPNTRSSTTPIVTPGGNSPTRPEANRTTTWITEYLIKRHEDVELIEKYMPVARLNKQAIAAEYDRIGDAGILRGFVWGDQAGCWQHACCLMSEQDLILEAWTIPDWVHRLLRALLDRKLRFIEESLEGAKFDLVETGRRRGQRYGDLAEAAPRVLPALRSADAPTRCTPPARSAAYHTCGGMMHILESDRGERDRRFGNARPARRRRQHHATRKKSAPSSPARSP